MLTRISLFVAIVAGLAVAGLNFTMVKEKITTLRTELGNTKNELASTQGDLASTKSDLAKTTKDRDEARGEIAAAQEERDKAVAQSETQTKRADRLAEDLTKSKQETSDAQAQLAAWSALGMAVEQVSAMKGQFNQIRDERDTLVETNKFLNGKIVVLKNRLTRYEDPDNYRVELPATLKGKVLVADPKWDFVVLNIGQQQGVLEDGVMIVNRNGHLVAKVQIRSVQPNRCIANVLPSWKLGDVMEGDEVIP